MTGAAQANLVTNGGFETRDFSGWTQFGTMVGTSVTCDLVFSDEYIHSGHCGGRFGAVGSPGGIFQSLDTMVGATYAVSFWLSNDSGTPNSMTFDWDGGVTELSLVDFPASQFQRRNFLLVATGAVTDLRFSFRHDPRFYGLDDIEVRLVSAPGQVSAPGSLALAGLAVACLGITWRRASGPRRSALELTSGGRPAAGPR